MAIDYDKLMNWPFEEEVQSYSKRDTILYALGLGLSMDPLDEAQLRFTYEEDLLALPSMAVVLASPGMWVRDPETGVDWVRVLHGEQGLEIHKALPAEATVTATTRITEIIDKGADKGALILQERTVTDQATGEALATLTSTTFGRGDGGFGGPREGGRPVHQLPEREPDETCDLATLPQAALIYRLSGDYNPLHADPEVARSANFEAPILHGLCTLGVASHAILRTQCGYDPARFKSLSLRFSAPVYPGETLKVEIWRDGDTASFRATSLQRDKVVLNNGYARLDGAG